MAVTPPAERTGEPRVALTRGDGAVLGLVVAAAAAGLLAAASPLAALAIVVGVAGALVLVTDLALALSALTVAAFLAGLPGAPGGALGTSKIVGVLVVAAWVGTLWRGGRGNARFADAHASLAWLLVALTAWMLASVAWAQDTGIAATSVARYALNALLVPIVFAALRDSRSALTVVVAFVGGAAFAAVYGIATTPPPELSTQAVRVAGTVGDANELATVLVAAVPLSVALAVRARGRPLLCALALVAGGCCVVGTLLSLSRGGLIALLAVGVAAMMMAGRRRAAATGLALVVIVTVVVYFGAVASPVARERVLDAGGGTGRSDLWTIALRMAADRPMLGVGAGNFPVRSVDYLLRPGVIHRDEFVIDTPKVAHNLYLGTLAELGVVGLTLLAAILIASIASALRAARRFADYGDGSMETLARAVAVALVGVLVASAFISDPYGRELWLLVGFGPGLLRIARVQGR